MNEMIKYKAGYTGAVASEDALHSLKYLREDTADLKKRYIALGFHLNEFCNNNYYKDFGYDNLNDFCYDNLGLDKTAISRCMGVWYRFSKRNELSGVATMFVDEKYYGYNYTQLTEMLPLTDEQLRKITPDMTCKQIRDYKKNLKVKKEYVASSDSSDSITPFDVLLENGDFMIDLVSFLEKYYKRYDKQFLGVSHTAKQIFFPYGEKMYKLTLSVSKK